MAKQTIYTVGGTVQAGGGVYIKRKADDELLELCRQSELAFILSSRQVGKSSLMVRTAQQLEKENICSVIVDLSAIGVKVSPDEWYLGILNEISTTLNLQTDIFAWWSKYAQLGQAQRLTNFFRDVLLKEVTQPVVLFFDEIDSTLSIPFSDDFYIALRAAYNARSTAPEFKRLSFVLVGVATPSDLISDSMRTPFNIGHRVELNDFTLEEAFPLAAGLGEQAQQTLSEIFYFTNGHPYLTQLLCASLANSKSPIAEESVANLVNELFTGEKGKKDNNLQFVRDMLTRRAPDKQPVLKIYKDIRAGKSVLDDERSIPKSHLKISGLVRRHDGQLVLRNRIYERAFDLEWIRENTPVIYPRQLVLASSLIALIGVVFSAYFGYQVLTRTPAEQAAGYVSDFRTNSDKPEEQLSSLAALFRLEGEYATQAQELFFQLPPNASKSLFDPALSNSKSADQIVVIKGVYQKLNNVSEDNTLLKLMGEAAESTDTNLASEIRFWLTGREKLNQGDYYGAEANLTEAIHLNPQNPALYFDRAQAYSGQGANQYQASLKDFSEVVQLDTEFRQQVRRVVNEDNLLSTYLNEHQTEFTELASAIAIQVQRIIYDAKNTSTLPGTVVRREGEPPTADVMVNEAYDALGIVYEFFWLVYDRDSMDNQGRELEAVVHYETGYDAAFWNGSYIVFGDGDTNLPENERVFNRSTSLDVTTIEFVHGMSGYEAGLQYFGQSGALQTSFGDVFAALVEQHELKQTAAEADWIIGEGLLTSNINGVGIRSLNDPGTAYDDPVLGKDPQPAHMRDYTDTTSDNGGVHINSGIPNRAFYIVAREIGGYAWEKAGRIWYITLCDKLQPDSDFQDAANKTFQVAGELYGSGSKEQEAVRKGWAEVGIIVEEQQLR